MNIETRAARLNERPEICHLIDLAFDAESHGPSLEHPSESVGSSDMDPHDRPQNTRILLVGGQIVSVVHVAEREAYACGERFPCGFVGMVATHPDHRGRGYMRRVMTDAQAYMQRRGFCYAVLMGGFRYYGGSLGWRPWGQKEPTLRWKHDAPTRTGSDPSLIVRAATADDVPFLSRVYRARYSWRFGPVVRSGEYWRRWSLCRPWEGSYLLVCDGTVPVGYCHAGHPRPNVDEIGWDSDRQGIPARVFAAVASWAGANGHSSLGFYIDEIDDVAGDAFREAFGDIPRTFVNPLGRPVEDGDRRPWLLENWPDGCGLMVRQLNPGPGPLAGVDSTDALTEVMARHHWTYFDADTI